jgi:hypothetical protein
LTSLDLDSLPTSPFICPITLKEMNGKHGFSYIASCGCLLSDQAFKELPDPQCGACNKPFEADSVIPLNPTKEETIEKLMVRLSTLKKKVSF